MIICHHCAVQRRNPNPADHCPVCARHILDMDMTGVEDDQAQRWCVLHLPDDHSMAYLKTLAFQWAETSDGYRSNDQRWLIVWWNTNRDTVALYRRIPNSGGVMRHVTDGKLDDAVARASEETDR